MKVQVSDELTINAPASKVWHVLAHDFANIDVWSSGIETSRNISDVAIPEGATVGGRVCSGGFGGDATEAFTYYDEAGMRFAYKAVGELPWFINSGGNNWSVRATATNQSMVAFSAEMDLKFWPALVMFLLKPVFKKLLGTRTLEELKYFVEHDKPHPRKLKIQKKKLYKSASL